jgi:hypothetical protein
MARSAPNRSSKRPLADRTCEQGKAFLFGLTAEQVAGSRDWYKPDWHYQREVM